MDKRIIDKNVFINPLPVVLIGSKFVGKDNFMTCAWVMRANAAPPVFAISLNKNHQTSPGIEENGAFSINIPSQELLEKTDFSGMVSARNYDKADLFNIFYGDMKKIPLIKECVVNLECKVVNKIELETNIIFFGEVIQAWSSEEYIKENSKFDFNKYNGFSMIMPDNIYVSSGKKIGNAWDADILKKYTE